MWRPYSSGRGGGEGGKMWYTISIILIVWYEVLWYILRYTIGRLWDTTSIYYEILLAYTMRYY